MKEDRMKEKVMEALKNHFRPEFLNRVDEVIIFHPLDKKEIREIVDIQLAHIRERLTEKHITLTVSDKAKDYLVKKGYDPNLGARPLRRLIQSEVLDKLAIQILEGKITDGDTVLIDCDKNAQIVLQKK